MVLYLVRFGVNLSKFASVYKKGRKEIEKENCQIALQLQTINCKIYNLIKNGPNFMIQISIDSAK